MLEINGLEISFRESGFSLLIDRLLLDSPGIIGVTGANGSGKTTLFKALVDLLPIKKGSINLFGNNSRKSEEWKKWTGVYLDESFLIEFLSAEEYFDFLIKVGDREKIISLENFREYDDFFNGQIWGQKKYIRDFSTGNKDKIGIASAMETGNRLVILDEPFAHLDRKGTSILKDMVKRHSRDRATAFLISSHDRDLLNELCDRILVMDNGRIIENLQVAKLKYIIKR